MTKYAPTSMMFVMIFGLLQFASACTTVPNGTCQSCDANGACDSVRCAPHWFNYDGDASNGCEIEYHVQTACPLPKATLGGVGYTGLCLNGWGETCGADPLNYIQTEAECRQFAQDNGVGFTLHNSVWKLGGCAYYMSGNPAQRSIFWFQAKPIGYVPPQNIRDKEVKAYAYICKDSSLSALIPEARSCCAEPVATPNPTPVPVASPVPAPSGCTTYAWDFGAGCVTTVHSPNINTCAENPDFPVPLTKAECEVYGAAPRPNWRFYQDPVYNGEVSDPQRPYGCVKHSNQNMYQWNNAVSGVFNKWWRLTCRASPVAEPTPNPTPQPTTDNACPTYTWDFDGTGCVGAQQLPSMDTCTNPMFPNPLSKAECESFGATHRPNWRFYQDPRYGGEVSDPAAPAGCIKHSNQNLYMWNTDTSGVFVKWWILACKGPAAAQPTPQPTSQEEEVVSCPPAYDQITGQNLDSEGTNYTFSIEECAQRCEDRWMPAGRPDRDCNSFQWSATVKAGDAGQCWLFQEGAPTDPTNRRSFTFCQKRQTGPSPSPPRQCHTYESDLFATDGTCLGVQSFPQTNECPIDFPTPLTKYECETFGSTDRPTWSFLKTPTYAGEMTDPNEPAGCVVSTSQPNTYHWNTVTDGNDDSSLYHLVCRREARPVACANYTQRRSCNREGGCLWLRPQQLGFDVTAQNSNGLCVPEDSTGVLCSMLDRRKCRDQSTRCVWGTRVNLGRHCVETTSIDCSTLSGRTRCGRIPSHCQWQNGPAGGCSHV